MGDARESPIPLGEAGRDSGPGPERGPGALRVIGRVARLFGAAYLAVAVFAYVFQRRLLYFPSPGPVPLPEGPRYRGIEEFHVRAADGTRLVGWYWPGERPIDILIFHGNAGHRGHRLEWLEGLRSLGCGLAILDYRGYGGSEGSPTERGLYLDAEAALSWLEERGERKREIVYFGESLGTAVAVELARRRPPAALILQSGFSSAADVGQRAYPFLPVRALMKDRFDSASKIGEVSAPILCIHGARDSIAPIRFARKLYEAAREPKEWFEVAAADHNDIPWVAGEEYLARIAAFLRK